MTLALEGEKNAYMDQKNYVISIIKTQLRRDLIRSMWNTIHKNSLFASLKKKQLHHSLNWSASFFKAVHSILFIWVTRDSYYSQDRPIIFKSVFIIFEENLFASFSTQFTVYYLFA